MTYEVVILPTAEDDLNALFDFIADQSGAVVAQRYVGGIEAFCMKLASFPNRGTPRGDLAPGIRTVSFERRALIAYKVDGGEVAILRIFAAGREYERELIEG